MSPVARARLDRAVRRRRAASSCPALLLMLVGPAGPASAQEPTAHEQPRVVACDSLVTLRRLAAASGENRAAAAAHASTEPGCRPVAREAVGAVERRAMFGGTPYECMTIAGAGTCLWVMP